MSFEETPNIPIKEIIEQEVSEEAQLIVGVGRPAEIFGAKAWKEIVASRERNRQSLWEQGVARGFDGSRPQI